jgi:phospholipid/cholesterol/gamma-HCH transport system substrate-binding protein/paraquat-inducible protein B
MMEEGKRSARLGLFVVVSLCLLAAALFMLGGRKWFQPTFTFETYFNQSVAGLNVGAPVLFRGVPLGHVSEILASAATYEQDVPLDLRRQYIVVRVEVNLSAREVAWMRKDAIKLTTKGLRAQTQLAGITGQQFLALDFLDARKYPPLTFAWRPEYPYIPSAPNFAGEIIAHAQTFLASLNEADIKNLGQNLNALVSTMQTKLGELPVGELSAKAHDVLGRADATLERLDAVLRDPALKGTLENVAVITARVRRLTEDGDLDRMVKGIDEAAERLDILIGDNQYDVRVIVHDLRVTVDNLRVLSETLKRYPAGVLVGGPPEKLKLPENSQ